MTRSFQRALLVGGCIVGCAEIAGITDYEVSGADGGNGAIQFAHAECGACVRAACSDELRQCEAEPSCRDLSSCLFGCVRSDDTCRYDCLHSVEDTPRSAKVLSACRVDRCPSECVRCGDANAAHAPGCAACVEGDVDPEVGLCDLIRSCLQDTECRRYSACLVEKCERIGLADPKCRMQCAETYADAARNLYQTMGGRYFSGCGAKCNGGGQWHCVQPAPWPAVDPQRKASVTLQLPPVDGVPVAGIRVRACPGDDFACARPIDEAFSDVSGAVHLNVPESGSPGSAYFDISEASDAGLAPVLFAPQHGLVGELKLRLPAAFLAASVEVTRKALESAASERDETIDDTNLGMVVVLVADCVGGLADLWSPAPRVTITSPSASSTYYMAFASGTPDPARPAGGAALLVNVPPDAASIVARVPTAGTATDLNARVPVRAGTITAVTFNFPQWW